MYIKSVFIIIFCGILILLTSCTKDLPEAVALAYESVPTTIDYNYHVRPILSYKCFSCHGPDEHALKGELRLDIEERAKASLKSGHGYAIKSGNVGKSQLVSRILHEDPAFAMPPAESNLILSAREKAILIKWIEQGAKYSDHWAFIAPTEVKVPDLPASYEAFNEVDHFIAAKLNANELPQSPLADRERLLRRVTMDITGLPPSMAEIKAFKADHSQQAYEKVVDRLLASDAYGERMAMDWMDVSRYADSHGLHADGYRLMWPWRDWVIGAFNRNMPYDQFVSWQIAGDMIPAATDEQKLATAFNRNHTMTAEGGAIEEEFRLSYVFDRTETVATAFLGLTVGCAKCHDHKFDPISQKEFYEMAAFFNNVRELGMTGDDGNYGPMLAIATPLVKSSLADLENSINLLKEDIALSVDKLGHIEKYINELPEKEPLNDRVFYGPLDAINGEEVDHLKNFRHAAENEFKEGKKNKAIVFTGVYDELYISDINCPEVWDPFSASIWVNTSKRDSLKTQTLMGTAGDKNNFWRGWDLFLDQQNRLNFRMINSLPHNYFHVRTSDAIPINRWNQVGFTYDGSGKGEGASLFINGIKQPIEIEFDQLYKTVHPIHGGSHTLDVKKWIRVGKSYRSFTGENGVFLGQMDEIKLYNRELSEWEMQLASEFVDKSKTSAVARNHAAHFDKSIIKKKAHLRKLVKEKIELYNNIDEVMVMEEMPIPRKAFVYKRGDYTMPSEQVTPNTPAVLHKFEEGYQKNRFGFSQWLFAKENPLTARVTVNRYWQLIFGNGIVSTTNDFGIQGSLPTHPALLDYLAIEFQKNDWNLKWLIKKMVMSYTYQQSSYQLPIHFDKDPANHLLARAPSYRLSAEMIRDNALAASGLLVQQAGGESVKPYQPEGLWIEKSSFSFKLLNYKENHGDSLYRRSLYTFLRRTSPPPAMTIFDAPNREVCTVKRENTNTPLQALVLMNDPQFVEASRVMAERVQVEGGEHSRDQIKYAFQLTTGREPSEEELTILVSLYSDRYDYYAAHEGEAKKLISVGEYAKPDFLNPSKTAAMAVVASTILNHNEAYMKR